MWVVVVFIWSLVFTSSHHRAHTNTTTPPHHHTSILILILLFFILSLFPHSSPQQHTQSTCTAIASRAMHLDRDMGSDGGSGGSYMCSEEGGEGSGGSDDNDYGEAHVLQLLLEKGHKKTKVEREAAVEYLCQFHQYYEDIPNQATLTAEKAGEIVAMVTEVSKRSGIKPTPLFALKTPYFNREKGWLMPFSEKTYHVYRNKCKEEEEKQVAAKEEENKRCVVHVYVCMVCACVCVPICAPSVLNGCGVSPPIYICVFL
jgi:hypothetical protein